MDADFGYQIKRVVKLRVTKNCKYRANQIVYTHNLERPSIRNSLKADVSENKQGTALENFETSTFCQKAKNACTTHFAFKESIGY